MALDDAGYDGSRASDCSQFNVDETAGAFSRCSDMDLSEYHQARGELQPDDAAAMDLSSPVARSAKRRFGQAAG